VIYSLNKSAEGVFDFATLMFEKQGDFYGADLNQTWVDNHIAELATTLGYSKADVAAGLADDNLNEDTRISWKYSTSRYSTGTPHYVSLEVHDSSGLTILLKFFCSHPLFYSSSFHLPDLTLCSSFST